MESYQRYERKAVRWNQKAVWTFETLCGIDGGAEAWEGWYVRDKGESACRDLVVHYGILFYLARCLSILWLWWESVQRAMIANKVRVFIAFKGHPYVEDFKWVLYLVNQLVECVYVKRIFVFFFPYVNCCECCMVCVFFLLMICKCGNVNWRWWGLRWEHWACGVLCSSSCSRDH